MSNLLLSSPDNYSPLDGKALVARKVKQLVSMAGRFDSEMGRFREFNVVKDSVASKITFNQWPTPIIFTGFEIGMKIFTGVPLIKSSIQNSPVKDVYEISIPQDAADRNGRMSWDQTAVLIAVRGYEKYYDAVRGRIVAIDNGSNNWDTKAQGHIYVKEKMAPKQVEEIINTLMLHQPKTTR
jgi:inosine-uridine nucleoside N-ribohydrolase